MSTIRALYQSGDTIIAPASLVGGGVAVIRASGPSCNAILAHLGVGNPSALPARTATLKTLTHNHEALDSALILPFPAPNSFTGEDVIELHTHGSPAVVNKILALATQLPGVRLAQPGEFSRRAVANGKMELTQAEGLADLIAASTESQRKQALNLLAGALGHRFEAWRQQIIHLLAQVEAGIDFPDEELDVLQSPALTKALRTLTEDLTAALEEKGGERIRSGIRLAIVGAPNAGKSTLLNLLAQADVAITSPTAGTTRDVVTKQLDIAGYPVEIADTAGLRSNSKDDIEIEGIRRARKQATQADVVLWVIPAADWQKNRLDDGQTLLLPGQSLILLSKVDELKTFEAPASLAVGGHTYPVTAADLTDPKAHLRLTKALTGLLAGVAGTAQQSAQLTRQRHRQAVQHALAALARAQVLLTKTTQSSLSELVAEELRQAAASIGEVTGRTDTETVLDEVFSTFCIGK